jgi:SOS-response transcriptional repressor LexA
MHSSFVKHNKRIGIVPLVDQYQAALGIAYIQNLTDCENQATVKVRDWHIGLFAFSITQENFIPRFYPGYQAIIDTTCNIYSGDYVLACVSGSAPAVYQYHTEKEQQWLLADIHGNDKILLSKKLPEDYVIQGVVVTTIMDSGTEDLASDFDATFKNFAMQTA